VPLRPQMAAVAAAATVINRLHWAGRGAKAHGLGGPAGGLAGADGARAICCEEGCEEGDGFSASAATCPPLALISSSDIPHE